jgi:hypothetical protein
VKTSKVSKKGTKTNSVPKVPTNDLEKDFPMVPFKKAPINGNMTISGSN